VYGLQTILGKESDSVGALGDYQKQLGRQQRHDTSR